MRVVLLLLCLTLAVSGERPAAGLFIVGLAALAGIAYAVLPDSLPGRAIRASESAVTALGIVLIGADTSPLFPYLLAPAFAGGLATGVEGAIIAPAVAAVVLLVGGLTTDQADLKHFATASAEWVLLAIAVGLLASWVRRLLLEGDQEWPYASAYRLLSELRTVARRLPGGLDALTIASTLLESIGQTLPYDRGAVLVRSGGDRLVPLAHGSEARLVWEADIVNDGPVAEAWAGQQPQVLPRQLSDMTAVGSGLVLPLRIGLRSFGLVGLESSTPNAFRPAEVAAAARVADELSLRLETALLFEDLREVATIEERRRLAREIHDGIAQELASLGYAIDELSAASRDGSTDVPEALTHLRTEVTRIVNELRLSIFDLRSDVDQHGGLGVALGEYLRSVGTGSGLTVHLTLTESTVRLPAETEAELLRIAQEAVTNARRHAAARNLWVTLEVEPPAAILRVEDDGRGLGEGRADSFGIEVMRERAARLRASLVVRNREGGGTLVEAWLGDSRAASSVAPNQKGMVRDHDRASR